MAIVSLHIFSAAIAVGIGATAIMDFWAEVQKRAFGIKPMDYALVGRWIGNFGRRHENITGLRIVRGEKILGWVAHYAIGIAFACVLVMVWGPSWLFDPKLGPALIVGIGSIAAPFFILQPSLGLGIAASRMPQPWISRSRSLSAHAAFGVGLYLAGLLVARVL